jgi:hypothetical protein
MVLTERETICSGTKRCRRRQPLVGAARRLLPLKTRWNLHPIKYALAAWENRRWVSDAWRPHLLAATVLAFPGPDSDDNPVVYQVREALRKL